MKYFHYKYEIQFSSPNDVCYWYTVFADTFCIFMRNNLVGDSIDYYHLVCGLRF